MQNQVVKVFENTFRRSFEKENGTVSAEVARTYLEHKDRRDLISTVILMTTGTWVVALAIAFMVLAGCAIGLRAVTPGGPRDTAAQAGAAVLVWVTCTKPDSGTTQRGSAVVLDERRILTAAHVIECWDKPEHIDPLAKAKVWIELPDGTHMLAYVGAVDRAHDLALIRPSRPLANATSPAIAEPRVGDRVCMSTAAPSRRWQCSFVVDVDTNRSDNFGEIRHNGEVHPGNSGSGVYDEAGRLVGIVTRLIPCNAKNPNSPGCGGRLAQVYGRTIAGTK